MLPAVMAACLPHRGGDGYRNGTRNCDLIPAICGNVDQLVNCRPINPCFFVLFLNRQESDGGYGQI